MGLYLRAKCQVSRIILTSFRQGVVFLLPLPPPTTTTTTKQTPKEPTQARLKQLSLNTKQEFEFMYHLIDGERLKKAAVVAKLAISCISSSISLILALYACFLTTLFFY